MTRERLEDIFTMDIPLEGIALNSGIYEFYHSGNRSIGISFEDEVIDNNPDRAVYIFNLFVDGDYVNIGGYYESIYDALDAVLDAWNEYERGAE